MHIHILIFSMQNFLLCTNAASENNSAGNTMKNKNAKA